MSPIGNFQKIAGAAIRNSAKAVDRNRRKLAIGSVGSHLRKLLLVVGAVGVAGSYRIAIAAAAGAVLVASYQMD